MIENPFYQVERKIGGKQLVLAPAFRDALNQEQQQAYIIDEVIQWEPNLPLPNPAAFLQGGAITSLVETFAGMDRCLKLDLSLWDVSCVENFQGVFYQCSKLTWLNVGNWDVSNGVYFDFMFHKCESLEMLDLENWNLKSGFSARYMFAECYGLKSLEIRQWNVQNLKRLGYMFKYCASLEVLNIADWNLSQNAELAGLMWGCNQLKQLIVPPVRIENCSRFLLDCANLKQVTFATMDFTKGNATQTRELFKGCYGLEAIYIKKSTFRSTKYCQKPLLLDESNFQGTWNLGAVHVPGKVFSYWEELVARNVQRKIKIENI